MKFFIRLALVFAAFVGSWALLVAIWLAVERGPRDEDFLARRGCVVHVELEPERAEVGGFVSQNVRLVSDTGLRTELRVLRPADDHEPRPLAVLLAGHRTGRDAVELLGSPGSLVVAALNYPYDGPERLRGVGEFFSMLRPVRQAMRDTPPAVLLATDWLLQQPWVDASRVELVGVSLGVPFAAVAGTLEPRFSRVWCIHGGADLRAWIDHNLAGNVSNGKLRGLASGTIYRVAQGAAFEPEQWIARVAPRSVVVIGARADQRLPSELVERLHAAAGEPKALRWTEGDHVDQQPGAVRELVRLVLEQVEDDSAP